MHKKGYQVTQIHLLKATSNCVEENNLDGSAEVNVFGGVSVVSQIWLSVKNMIHSCNDRMIVFMDNIGVNKDLGLSPFYEDFKTVLDMFEAYIDYSPRTF